MRTLPISIVALGTLVVGLTVPVTAQEAPCAQITAACKNAGFTLGGASTGTGLLGECIIPIMQGIAQPAAATRPLPQVAPQLVAACKANHPSFGQGKVPTPAADTKPALASAARPLAAPVSPAAAGSAVTNGSGMTPPNSSVTAGAGSLQPGIPSGQGGHPAPVEDVKKSQRSLPMTCKIGTMNEGGWQLEPKGSVSFSRTKGPASSGLQPGECAFEDRAVRPSEPNWLCFEASPYTVLFQGSTVQSLNFRGPGAAILNSAANGPTKLMNFMVHQEGGSNCMVIDSYGP